MSMAQRYGGSVFFVAVGVYTPQSIHNIYERSLFYRYSHVKFLVSFHHAHVVEKFEAFDWLNVTLAPLE